MRPTVINGGSFNLLSGRGKTAVRLEVEELVRKWKLDFLPVQEAADYERQLNAIKGFTYFTGTGHRGTKGNGILVADHVRVNRVRYLEFGDGWTTVKGKHHLPLGQMQVCLDNWLLVRSIHLMTPSHWVGGELEMAKEREDDYIAHWRGLQAFLRPPRTHFAALASGDWNEKPETFGDYSPGRLLRTTNSKAFAPAQKAGHGRIDWSAGKGLTIGRTFKDLETHELSDHEPVIHLNIRKKAA